MADEGQKAKKPIQVLRDLHGGMSEGMKEYYKTFNKTRKAITEALKEGAKTVPELSSTTGLKSNDVLWHVMAMKKYGHLKEVDERGDYVSYTLIS